MPPMSTLRTFILAIQSKQTNTTKALNLLLEKNPNGPPHPLQPYLDRLKAANFSGVLPAWTKLALTGAGVAPGPEMDHIDSWPNKNQVREWVIKAISENRSIHFSWELHDGNNEENQVQDPANDGNINVTFRSPNHKVHQLGADQISIDV